MAGRLLSAGRRLLADALPVTVLAAIAGAGSFTHIRDTAAQHGQGGPQGRGPAGPAVLAALAALATPDPGAAQPGGPLQPRRERLAAHEPADLAVDQPAEWVPESKTATVPGESVTATATPVSVT